jgi:hypothetical protein
VASAVVAVLLGGNVSARGAEEAECLLRARVVNGVRFVAVCPTGYWIAATPVPCEGAAPEGAACDPVTALEASALDGAGKNRPLDAWVGGAALAARVCAERYGGRLPTLEEREWARHTLALASLRVREEPGEFPRLLPHPQREWVTQDGAPARYPAATTPAAPGGDRMLRCVAEPAMPQARAVPIGASCPERPSEGGVRSPDCAVAVPGTEARFELGCDVDFVRAARGAADDAAFRCVSAEAPPARPGAPRE